MVPKWNDITCLLLHGPLKKETDTVKETTMASGGFVIVIRNNSFLDSK